MIHDAAQYGIHTQQFRKQLQTRLDPLSSTRGKNGSKNSVRYWSSWDDDKREQLGQDWEYDMRKIQYRLQDKRDFYLGHCENDSGVSRIVSQRV